MKGENWETEGPEIIRVNNDRSCNYETPPWGWLFIIALILLLIEWLLT